MGRFKSALRTLADRGLTQPADESVPPEFLREYEAPAQQELCPPGVDLDVLGSEYAQPLSPITVLPMETEGNELFEQVIVDGIGKSDAAPDEVEEYGRCFDATSFEQFVSDPPQGSENTQVAKIVEQILGISPNIRLAKVSKGESETKATQPKVEQIERTGLESDLELEADSNSAHSSMTARAESALPARSAFTPVIETWMTIPPESEHVTVDPVRDALFSQSAASPGPTEASIEPEATALQTRATVEELRSQESPSLVEALSLAGPSPALPKPALPETLAPTPYEVSIAERLLQSDFGVRIQQLSSQLQSQLQGDGPHIVIVLSIDVDPQRADAVAGLGMFSCAHRTEQTLLVDADVDSRMVSRGFEKRGPGILEGISGQVLWSDSVQATSCEKLRMLPCGHDLDVIGGAPDFDQLDRVEEMVEDWKRDYGLILIDGGLGSSPLALSLSRHANATYVCVQLGKDHRQELVTTSECVAKAGGRVSGCITTGSSPQQPNFG